MGQESSCELWGAAEWEPCGAQIRLDWARDPEGQVIQLARNVDDRRAGAKAEARRRSSNLGRYADEQT